MRNGRKMEDFLNQNASGKFASSGFRTSPIKDVECDIGDSKSPLSNAAIANEKLKITHSFSCNGQVQLMFLQLYKFCILSQT